MLFKSIQSIRNGAVLLLLDVHISSSKIVRSLFFGYLSFCDSIGSKKLCQSTGSVGLCTPKIGRSHTFVRRIVESESNKHSIMDKSLIDYMYIKLYYEDSGQCILSLLCVCHGSVLNLLFRGLSIPPLLISFFFIEFDSIKNFAIKKCLHAHFPIASELWRYCYWMYGETVLFLFLFAIYVMRKSARFVFQRL